MTMDSLLSWYLNNVQKALNQVFQGRHPLIREHIEVTGRWTSSSASLYLI
jgi:hypothetical protein